MRDRIALAHRDSIRSLGPGFYPPRVVDDWAEGLTPDLYIRAMEGGEIFFIAVTPRDELPAVLGFASDYRREGSQHGTSVYVRGASARRGIGSTLFKLAEAETIARGATSIRVEASLAGLEFYKANGFVEISRGQTHLMSGRPRPLSHAPPACGAGWPVERRRGAGRQSNGPLFVVFVIFVAHC